MLHTLRPLLPRCLDAWLPRRLPSARFFRRPPPAIPIRFLQGERRIASPAIAAPLNHFERVNHFVRTDCFNSMTWPMW